MADSNSGKAGSARIEWGDPAYLRQMEKHGQIQDRTSLARARAYELETTGVIDPFAMIPMPVTTTGLNLVELYKAHVAGLHIDARSIGKFIHLICQFPIDLVDGEEPEWMLLTARSFAETIWQPGCIFGDRVDRHERSRHVVDLFIAPTVLKVTKHQQKEALSLTKGLDELCRRTGVKIEGKGPQKLLHSYGRALQTAWFEHLVAAGVEGVERGHEKETIGPDRLSPEMVALSRERERAKAATAEAEALMAAAKAEQARAQEMLKSAEEREAAAQLHFAMARKERARAVEERNTWRDQMNSEQLRLEQLQQEAEEAEQAARRAILRAAEDAAAAAASARAAEEHLSAATAAHAQAEQERHSARVETLKAKDAARMMKTILLALHEWSEGRLLAAMDEDRRIWRWRKEPDEKTKAALQDDLRGWEYVRKAMGLRHAKVSSAVTDNDIRTAAANMVTTSEIIAFVEAQTWEEAERLIRKFGYRASDPDRSTPENTPRWEGLKREWHRKQSLRRD